MKACAVIPARLGSGRFPDKPLIDIAGVSLLERCCRICEAAEGIERVVVATPDERVAEAARSFGGEAVMTSQSHPSGSDRVSEAAGEGWDAVVNFQADEPLVKPETVTALLSLLTETDADITTPVCPIAGEEMVSFDAVKAVVAGDGRALYFSRLPVPYSPDRELAHCRKHVGVYAFRGGALERFAALPPSVLERAERLEQLRALEAGMRVRCLELDYAPLAVNRREDAALVEGVLSEGPG